MDKFQVYCKQKYEGNKERFFYCIGITFIIGLITHGYMYMQDTFTHDSLNEFIYDYSWKIQLGRYFAAVYKVITMEKMVLPWLIGFYSLLWIGCSVFLVTKIFDIQNKFLIVLVSGIFTANITVIATTATYMHDLDSYMFALFMSVLAVFLWKNLKYGYIFAAPFIAISLASYQAYVSVTITLIIIVSILELLEGRTFKLVFSDGIKSLVSLLLGAILYIAGFKLVLSVTGLQKATGGFNTIDSIGRGIPEWIYSFKNIYKNTCQNIFSPISVFPKVISIFIILLITIALCLAVFYAVKNSIGLWEILLIFFLLLVMPLTMNIAGFLYGSIGHDLMRFAIWLIYLFALLIIYRVTNKYKMPAKYVVNGVCYAIIIYVIMNNVSLANEAYLRKDLVEDANHAFFTRVIDAMEKVDEYDNEITPVVFIGIPDLFLDGNVHSEFNASKQLIGAFEGYVFGVALQERYQKYFDYKFLYQIKVVDECEYEKFESLNEVKTMPLFPQEGSMSIVDETLVVKFQ